MFWPETALKNQQRPLVIGIGLVVLLGGLVEDRQVVERHSNFWMGGAENLLLDRERLEIECFSFRSPASRQTDAGEIIEDHGYFRRLPSVPVLENDQTSPVKLLGFVVFPLAFQKRTQRRHIGGDVWMI